MQEPPAVERARAVVRHAKYLGAPLHQFAVSVTKQEGFELLDWFRSEADPIFIDIAELERAITQAKASDDPFDVLKDLRLLGLEMVYLS